MLAGTGVAAWSHQEVWWKAALALVVSLLLQVGVNYANDYSDGIRGTDDARVGPLRLVGSRVATPQAVKRAAFLCFGLAGVVGLVLAATTAWWLVAVGALSILAAWYYTGGKKPYGYLGLGEVMVFVFFGLVAVMGTWFVQVHDHEIGFASYGHAPDWTRGNHALTALLAAIGVGVLACAILVANNLRDIPTDTESGKHTLAVKLGDRRTRGLYVFLLAVAVVMLLRICIDTSWWAALGFLGFVLLVRAAVLVVRRAAGRDLIPILQLTGLGELVYAAGLFAGLLLAR